MIKYLYRPVRSTLQESMLLCKSFDSLDDLLNYCVLSHKTDLGFSFLFDDLSFHYSSYDDRCDWETYHICSKRYYDEKYEHPQCVGYLTFKFI